MVIAKKHKKIVKLSIYIGLLLVGLFWLSFGLVHYWNNNYSKALTKNAAVLAEAVSIIANLEDISTIEPSKTSGNLPGVVSVYKSALESVDTGKLSSPSMYNTGLHSNKKEIKVAHKEAAESLEATTYNLQNVTDSLTIMQKFIEYAPAVDLDPYKNGQEADASERLSRTQAGIQNTIKAVEDSRLPYRKAILDVLRPLEKKATEVTPQTVDTWASEVLEAQKQILIIIQADYEDNIDSSTQNLRAVSENYLQLR